MSNILRNPEKAAQESYDLLIVGAGIYGVALALQASTRGLRALLLDKKDFGWSTTYNHLRTVHGGLRYLQNLDLPRFFESVAERHWFLKEFPGLVAPLPCLMPLYGNGPYRPSVFRVALGLNDLLSWRRNRHVASGQELPAGSVVDAATVARLFPLVDRQGLQGGAVWHDGGMPSSQLLIMAMLKRACAAGATALNYLEGQELLVADRRVIGLRCLDAETGRTHEFRSTRVINAAGPSCRIFAATFAQDDPELFRPSLAWNVLFNRTALSAHSLAVRPKRPGSRMYFVHGFNGLIMGGTVHAPWTTNAEPMPTADEVTAYIDDLNLAVPELNLQPEEVLQVYAGLLPAREQDSTHLAVREVIRDHSQTGGPQGAYTVSGVKFTTARLVAEKTLNQIFPPSDVRRLNPPPCAPASTGTDAVFAFDWSPEAARSNWQQRLQRIIAEESVLHLEDLIVRRTTLGDNPIRAMAVAPLIAALFDWDATRRQEEVDRVYTFFLRRTTAPDQLRQTLAKSLPPL